MKSKKRQTKKDNIFIMKREREREKGIHCSNHGGDKHPKEGAKWRSESRRIFHTHLPFRQSDSERNRESEI